MKNHPLIKDKGGKGTPGKLVMAGRWPKSALKTIRTFHATKGKMK